MLRPSTSTSNSISRASSLFVLSLLAASCGGKIGDLAGEENNPDWGDEETLPASDVADEDTVSISSAINAQVGGQARTTEYLNLRTGPGTGYRVILVMTQGALVNVTNRSGSWFQVRYDGTVGWCHGGYLDAITSAASSPAPAPTNYGSSAVEAAMDRAQSGVGFSYHWGGGCWQPGSSSKGACYGGCPDCSHSGQWGADCSGYVTKVWQVPGPVALTTCGHGPYTSGSYYSNRDHWTQVQRSSARRGDAFVRQGHILIMGGGDAWGSLLSYEAKGCSYGIVRNNRTADSSYRVIRRHGF